MTGPENRNSAAPSDRDMATQGQGIAAAPGQRNAAAPGQRTAGGCCWLPTPVLSSAAALLLAPAVLYAAPPEPGTAAYTAAQADRQLQIFVAAETNYDDNLFRLPANLSTQAAGLGADSTRMDRIDVASAGLSYQWQPSAQTIKANAGAAYNRFANNGILNNTSRYAKLEWDWRLADRWSGQLGSNYTEALANFANNHFFAKDILRSSGYFGEIDWQLGPHVFLSANARHSSTTHSAAERVYEDYAANTGGTGVKYVTEAGNEFGWEYRYTHADYPHNAQVKGIPFDQKFAESTSGFHLKYLLTGKTQIEASAGYLKRDYPTSNYGDFSGSVWHTTLTWAPGAKTQVVFNAWRQLTAYLDAQSDYFVSNGVSIAPTWQPTTKLSFALQYTRDRDRYIGSSFVAAPVPDTRRETVSSGKFIATWDPTDLIRVTAAYKFERRHSTVDLFTYDDNLETIDIRFML
ncbi:MAG: outer membrane beta-barrel protein [Steroidobacteraceae bacterium]